MADQSKLPEQQTEAGEVAEEELADVAGGGNSGFTNVYSGGSFYAGSSVKDSERESHE